MGKSKSLGLKLEMRDGRTKLYLRISAGDNPLLELRINVPTKPFIAFITSTSVVAELVSRYPQITAILQTAVGGG